jgi:hypothetical protein
LRLSGNLLNPPGAKEFLSALVLASLMVTLTSLAGTLAAESAAGGTQRQSLGRPFACADYGGNRICLVSKGGEITWQYPAVQPQDVWVLPNGNILFSHIRGAREVTPQKDIAWEYKSAEQNEVHACQPLSDGTVMVAESGPMRIVEVDRQGKIAKEVKLATMCTRTHLQMRCARRLANGNYLVGQYGDGVVREYGSTGDIVRDVRQEMAFSGIRLPSGNTLIAAGDAHRIIEVDAGGKVVWQITENELPGNPLRFVAGMQRLPNGNTVVCNWGGHGHVGQQPQVFEVTHDKRIVGQLFDFAKFGTISGIYLMDVEGDATQYEILR